MSAFAPLVLAYHGCDACTRDDLVSRRLSGLDLSRNQYDWLGDGIYFFENDHKRALSLAQHSHDHPERLYTKRPIGTPAVVGAVLRLEKVLDMTTQEGIEEFLIGLDAFQSLPGAHRITNAEPSEDDMMFLRRDRDSKCSASSTLAARNKDSHTRPRVPRFPRATE